MSIHRDTLKIKLSDQEGLSEKTKVNNIQTLTNVNTPPGVHVCEDVCLRMCAHV